MPIFDGNHWQRQGAKIRAIANDIKRDGESLAREIAMEEADIQEAFDGNASPEEYDAIINRMVDLYPVSRLDLDIRRDDTDEGVVVQTAENSKASSRITHRSDSTGSSTPYYEYRDAAMSSVGPYRPEWIKELRSVSSEDANDADVAYNSGHLMHQNTFFVGPVNFYWKIAGEAYMAQMNTGDSNYITPFVPHSFATRDLNQEAYIVAVTFTGKLDTVHQDVMVLDPQGVEDSLLDLSNPLLAFSGILIREMSNSMLGIEHLRERTGLEFSRLSSFLDGTSFPLPDELLAMAEALGTNVRDLMPPEASQPTEVVVQHRSDGKDWLYPSEEIPHYAVHDLANTHKIPLLRSMSLKVLEDSDVDSFTALELSTPFHEFCYNFGEAEANLYWQGVNEIRKATIEPGGSYYIKPTVPHALRSVSASSKAPELVVMRVGGALYGDAHLELSSYPKESLGRVLRETEQWYNPTKIGG